MWTGRWSRRRLTRATDRDKLATIDRMRGRTRQVLPLGQIRAIEDATAVQGEW